MNGRLLWPGGPTEKEASWIEDNVVSLESTATVLDPFCGSGNVLYSCGIREIKSVGVETDPLLHWLSSAKSFMYGEKDGKLAGYSWERVADNVFWESDLFNLPEIQGSTPFKGKVLDFLGRVRYQIDTERYEGSNNMLKLALLDSLKSMPLSDENFDDRNGSEIYSDSLSKIIQNLSPNTLVNQSVYLRKDEEILYRIRRPYEQIISILKPISEPENSTYLDMYRWLGFENLNGKTTTPGKEVFDTVKPITETPSILSWCDEIFSVMKELPNMMSSQTEGKFMITDESPKVPKDELLCALGTLAGLRCKASGDTFYFCK